jgi:YfiH family protein
MIKVNIKNLNIWTSERKDESIIFFPGLNKPSHLLNSILKSIPIPRNRIIETNQVHGNNIVIIGQSQECDDDFVKIPSCDGLITTRTDIALMIKTADCIPLVIYDSKKQVYATIHAGWRGLVKNIHQKALNIFKKKYKSDLNNIHIYIGPSIRKCCYSFSEKPSQTNQKSWVKYIYFKNNLWHIDLQGYLTESLINLGVQKTNIIDSGLCTYHQEKQFFSHLRHKQKSDTSGSMVTIVQLKS